MKRPLNAAQRVLIRTLWLVAHASNLFHYANGLSRLFVL